MKRVLAFDKGNRALKAALFESNAIVRRWSEKPGDSPGLIAGILDTCDPDGVAFSSVVPLWKRQLAQEMRRRGITYVEAGSGIRLPFNLLVRNPDRLGGDRIGAASGVVSLNHREAVIVDAGTAVTVDLLSGEGFLGGLIFPGIGMLLESLHEGTDLLPRVEYRGGVPEIPGDDTEAAMAAGAFWGWIGAVRELVTRSLSSLSGQPPVFVTGGNAGLVAPYCTGDVTIDEDLVFRGLLLLFELNT
jgi:type III pantothenate kinase